MENDEQLSYFDLVWEGYAVEVECLISIADAIAEFVARSSEVEGQAMHAMNFLDMKIAAMVRQVERDE